MTFQYCDDCLFGTKIDGKQPIVGLQCWNVVFEVNKKAINVEDIFAGEFLNCWFEKNTEKSTGVTRSNFQQCYFSSDAGVERTEKQQIYANTSVLTHNYDGRVAMYSNMAINFDIYYFVNRRTGISVSDNITYTDMGDGRYQINFPSIPIHMVDVKLVPSVTNNVNNITLGTPEIIFSYTDLATFLDYGTVSSVICGLKQNDIYIKFNAIITIRNIQSTI